MILQANALKIPLADKSVHMVCTSPPYWGLRQYSGIDGEQLGLEDTPEEFIENCVKWGREVWRVLRDDGVLFLNMGDSYAAQGNRSGNNGYTDGRENRNKRFNAPTPPGLKPKDLCMMPARLAIALQADGWYLRSMMPWVKRSAMPESCTDRPASALEYVFLLTKGGKYFFDMNAIRKPIISVNDKRYSAEKHAEAIGRSYHNHSDDMGKGQSQSYQPRANPAGRNFRNTDLFYQSLEEPHGAIFSGDEMVGLDVNPYAYKESHFATFPPKLIVPLIKAGTSEKGCCVECGAPRVRMIEMTPEYKALLNSGKAWQTNEGKPDEFVNRHEKGHPSQVPTKNKTIGWKPSCKHKSETKPCVVLDIFGGSGTVKDVAERLGRKAIVTELSWEYCMLAKKRCCPDQMKLI